MKINAMNQNPRQRYFKGWNKMQRWNKGYDVLNEYPGSGVQMNDSFSLEDSTSHFIVDRSHYTYRVLDRSVLSWNGSEELYPLLYIRDEDSHADTESVTNEQGTLLPYQTQTLSRLPIPIEKPQSTITASPHQRYQGRNDVVLPHSSCMCQQNLSKYASKFSCVHIDHEDHILSEDITSVYLIGNDSLVSSLSGNSIPFGVTVNNSPAAIHSNQDFYFKNTDRSVNSMLEETSITSIERAQRQYTKRDDTLYRPTNMGMSPKDTKSDFPLIGQYISIKNAGFSKKRKSHWQKESDEAKGVGNFIQERTFNMNLNRYHPIPETKVSSRKAAIWAEEQLPFDLIVRDNPLNFRPMIEGNKNTDHDRCMMKDKILRMNQDWKAVQRQDKSMDTPYCFAFTDMLVCS